MTIIGLSGFTVKRIEYQLSIMNILDTNLQEIRARHLSKCLLSVQLKTMQVASSDNIKLKDVDM